MQSPQKSDNSPTLAKAPDLQWILAASGGTIASLGLSATADASLVQITQTGNFVSASTGVSIDQDLTGDGGADVTWVGGFSTLAAISAKIVAGGPTLARAFFSSFFTTMFARVDGTVLVSSNDPTGVGPVSATGLVSLTFADPDVNGGGSTIGLVEITAVNDGTPSGTRVDITRLIFDDADSGGAALPDITTVAASYTEFVPGSGGAVPEASELAILALGAGGVMAHRRRKRKAA